MKKITFIVETDSENKTIEAYLMRWIKEHFQKSETAEIKIEDLKDYKEVLDA